MLKLAVMADDLYDLDFYLWTRTQAEALRARSTNALDYDLLAEEIEDMGKRDLRECASRVRQILIHLWKLAATRREEPKGHWKAEVLVQRNDLADALTPSLRGLVEQAVEKLHLDAVKAASRAFETEEPTALPLDPALRWTLAQVLGEDNDPLG